MEWCEDDTRENETLLSKKFNIRDCYARASANNFLVEPLSVREKREIRIRVLMRNDLTEKVAPQSGRGYADLCESVLNLPLSRISKNNHHITH